MPLGREVCERGSVSIAVTMHADIYPNGDLSICDAESPGGVNDVFTYR